MKYLQNVLIDLVLFAFGIYVVGDVLTGYDHHEVLYLVWFGIVPLIALASGIRSVNYYNKKWKIPFVLELVSCLVSITLLASMWVYDRDVWCGLIFMQLFLGAGFLTKLTLYIQIVKMRVE